MLNTNKGKGVKMTEKTETPETKKVITKAEADQRIDKIRDLLMFSNESADRSAVVELHILMDDVKNSGIPRYYHGLDLVRKGFNEGKPLKALSLLVGYFQLFNKQTNKQP